MKLKVLICNCKINILFQKQIDYFHPTRFSQFRDDHKYFAAICPSCLSNASAFARDYISPTNCFFLTKYKILKYGFCLTLKLTFDENLYGQEREK